MYDRALLELAAKAAGYEVRRGGGHLRGMLFMPVANPNGLVTGREWNPLADDGDALRLAVTLGIADLGNFYDSDEADPYAATRRAIVRAAAEIGRGMGGSNPQGKRRRPARGGVRLTDRLGHATTPPDVGATPSWAARPSV